MWHPCHMSSKRRLGVFAIIGLTAVCLWALTRQAQPPNDINEVPNLVGLPVVYHFNVLGLEGWKFTGPAKPSDVLARLGPILEARGWRQSGMDFELKQPHIRHEKPIPWTEVDRRTTSLTLTIEPGRASAVPIKTPLSEPWTTVTMEADHVTEYSGPGLFVGWRTYR